MAGLLDGIADFFFQLFSGDSEAIRRRKQTRELQETLLSVRPPVWNKANGKVLPGFAQGWLQFYQLILPLFDLLTKTVGSPDKKVEDLSRQYLIESLLVGDIAERRLALSYDALKTRFKGTANPNSLLAAVNIEFSNLLGDIRRQDSATINQDVQELYKLKNIVTHSFHGLFRKFGYDLAAFGKEPARFNAIEGDSVIPELLDLYFLIGQFELSSSVERGLAVLLERVNAEKAEQNLRKMEKLLGRLGQLLRGSCSSYLTLTLIRLLRQEPDLVPEVWKPRDNPLQDYIDVLSDHFAHDRDRVVRELAESSLEKDIRALFPQGDLLALEGYGDETNQELLDAGLPGLTLVTPLSILKSFSVAVLAGGFLDQVKQIVLNGFFQDKEYANKLSNSLYVLENVLVRLETFDRGLLSEGKTTFVTLEKYISGKTQGSSVPNQIIDKINRTASEFLEKETNEIAALAVRVSEVLQDYKSPQPQYVTNIKGLGGKNHKDIVQGLVLGYNRTLQFLKIMKNFVVVRGLKVA